MCRHPVLFERIQTVLQANQWPQLHTMYILCQLLRILGQDVDPVDFEYVKSIDLAIQNDNTWRMVCHKLDWVFKPMV
jgi:hypothetical protein